MPTGVCLRFKQNAWKKEFCSNCYRLREEHKKNEDVKKFRFHLPLKEASQGILNVGSTRKAQKVRKTVRFTKEESEVIGYGGLETVTDDDDDDDDFDNLDIENFEPGRKDSTESDLPGDDEKALEKLTKINTNFNSNLDNLSTKKSPQKFNTLPKDKTLRPIVPSITYSFITNENNFVNNIEVEENAQTQSLPVTEKASPEESKLKCDINNPKLDSDTKIKTIIINGKKEEKVNPERKAQITRGSVITKSHEEAKKKLCIQNIKKGEKRNSLLENEIDEGQEGNNIEVVKCQTVEEKNVKNVQDSPSPKPVLEDLSTSVAENHKMTLEPVTHIGCEILPETREMAGEPDGKADSDEIEKVTPPPRSSFLHRENTPSSPPKKKIPLPDLRVKTDNALTPPPPAQPPKLKVPDSPQSLNSTPASLPYPCSDIPSQPLETNNPILQEVKCKRLAPKPPVNVTPEPHPRRRNSLEVITPTLSEKKKTRVRQTLKKLWWFANKEEESPKYENFYIPTHRPRPQIIHPLDLNKTGVQVLPPQSTVPNGLQNGTARSPGDGGTTGSAPVKPQRSGSLRSRTKQIEGEDNIYEQIEVDRSVKKQSYSDPNIDIYYPYVAFKRDEDKAQYERGVVHSTLEGNYSAVVIANLEALTNMLHQVNNKINEVPKFVKDCDNLLWKSFDLEDKPVVTIGQFSFFEAKLNLDLVTLGVTREDLSLPDVLRPATVFKDVVPTELLQNDSDKKSTITVLQRLLRIHNALDYFEKLDKSPEGIREGVLVLLKILNFINTGKDTLCMENFLVFSAEDEPTPTPCYLPSENESMPSKEAVLSLVSRFLKDLPLENVLTKCSVSEMEQVLQVWLWGPTKVLSNFTLQHWLDLERAKFLQAVVCSNPSTLQKEHLKFLVQTSTPFISKALNILHKN
ncbi:uncharacterized protein LOC106661955 isoform X2 [Cimex lectularius]|uniref:Uncharacterized protein n=1 Tax=Cimex lectularius TaxID=79782 RepID=A0A8I6R9U7_CIMLE|nr:uncharacterized protein LOC106661955 isoform X2 [Cimex lectularius]